MTAELTGTPTAIVLGTILSQNVRLRNLFFAFPRPIGKASGAILEQVGGKVRIIELTCRKTGTKAELKTFVDSVDDWADTTRQSSATYTTVLGTTHTVFCEDFDYDLISNKPNVLVYTLTMKEGGSVADQFAA